MKLSLPVYSLFLFILDTYCSYTPRRGFPRGNQKELFQQLEPLIRVEMIKSEIMRRLQIPATSQEATTSTVQLPTTRSTQKPSIKKQSDFLTSYSEAPEEFQDEHIIQFKLTDGKKLKTLQVTRANLLVRVKYKKRRTKRDNAGDHATTRSKKMRNGKRKKVDIVISTVNEDGAPGDIVSSIKSTLRKTKWLKISIPEKVVQKSMDSVNKTLQMYVKCLGCDKRAHVILVHKRNKRKQSRKHNRKQKLHKRRPFLLLHTNVKDNNEIRKKRSAQHRQCDSTSNEICEKREAIINIQDFLNLTQLNIYPREILFSYCLGIGNEISIDTENTLPSSKTQINTQVIPMISEFINSKSYTKQCIPSIYKSLHLTLTQNNESKLIKIPGALVSKCTCG